jgi:hypothetical protein
MSVTASESLSSSPVPQVGLIVATEQPEWKRLAFLPRFFGPRHMMRGEALVFAWMKRLAPSYQGGFWRFFELSNGGFYLAPALEKPLRLCVEGNGFAGELSADGAGLVVSLFGIAELANATGLERLAEHYHHLLEFAVHHPESALIHRAID